MSRPQAAHAPATANRPGTVSLALARDRLGVPAVLFIVMAAIAPLTVGAGVIPTAFATTGLTGIPAAFVVVAVILAVFATGYMAMSRRITHSGAFYAFVTRGLGKPAGVAAALIALVAYTFLQTGLYGALGPAAQAEAAAHLGVHEPWWVWALIAWALVAALGLLRVDITGKVLGVLLVLELAVVVADMLLGLTHPVGGHLSFATLSPTGLGSAGFATFGVLAVVAGLGFVGWEFGAGLSEEARSHERTIPRATYLALSVIAVVYAGAAWAMAAHYGTGHVAAAAGKLGPALLFTLGGSGWLAQAGQLLFMTSLFAAALAFHNVVVRYMFSLGRENILPPALGRTHAGNVPRMASATQSATGVVVIGGYALTGASPMTGLFFGLGTTGGFGVLVLLAVTSVAVIAFFARYPRGESAWQRLIAPNVEHAMTAGTVHTTPGRDAAALWIPVGDTPPQPPEWYAAALAALLQAYHEILDTKIRQPAYLEASSERSRRVYLHRGYTNSGPPIVLPDGRTSLFPMVRQSRSAALAVATRRAEGPWPQPPARGNEP